MLQKAERRERISSDQSDQQWPRHKRHSAKEPELSSREPVRLFDPAEKAIAFPFWMDSHPWLRLRAGWRVQPDGKLEGWGA